MNKLVSSFEEIVRELLEQHGERASKSKFQDYLHLIHPSKMNEPWSIQITQIHSIPFSIVKFSVARVENGRREEETNLNFIFNKLH